MTSTRRLPALVLAPLLAVLGAAAGCPSNVAAPCKGAKCGAVEDEGEPRFFAEPPFGVGFECVTIGCDTEKTVTVENRGGGTLALSLIRQTIDTSTDFTVRRADDGELPTADDQATLKAGETLELRVRYVPSDGILDEGALQFEHYDGSQAYEDAAPVTDEVPLTARAIGVPAATLPTEVLDFGFVTVGDSKSLDLVVENGGSEAVLRVGPASIEDGTADVFHPADDADWTEHFANPGSTTTLPVVFTPATPDAFFGALLVQTNDPERPTIRVVLQGTAIAEPRLVVVEPTGDLVLPPVRVGETRLGSVVVRNIGGQPLDVGAEITSGGDLGFVVSPGTLPAIAPLAIAHVDVTLLNNNGGDVSGALTLTSNDPSSPAGSIVNLVGTVNAPLLTAAPGSLEFGNIVQGWTAEPQALAVGNTGFGELTLTSIAFEVGSSSQVQIVDVPPLPVKLAPGESIVVTLLVNAVNLGPSNAVLLVGSDSINTSVSRVDVHANVITCDQGCPIAFGTPDCSSGSCEVGTCVAGHHDADNGPGNGCECQEDVIGSTVGDIPGACLGLDLGTLSDDSGGFNRSGTLHSLTDTDLYFIRMRDDTQFLNDDYGGQVELVSAPPGLQVCANFQDNGTGCGGQPTNCSFSRVRGNGQSGIFGGSDNSEDATIFVNWAPNSNPVCGSYTIRFRADADF